MTATAAGARVAQLGGRRALRSRGDRATHLDRRDRRCAGAGRRARPARAGRRRGALLQRHRAHRWVPAEARPHEPAAGGRSLQRAGARAGGHHDPRAQRAPRRDRPRAGEPRRHRRAEHRRRDLDRHARHRRAPAQHSLAGGGAHAGARRRLHAALLRAGRARAAARRARGAGRARRGRGGDAALRARLPPARRSMPPPPWSRRWSASRSWHSPTTISNSTSSPTPAPR